MQSLRTRRGDEGNVARPVTRRRSIGSIDSCISVSLPQVSDLATMESVVKRATDRARRVSFRSFSHDTVSTPLKIQRSSLRLNGPDTGSPTTRKGSSAAAPDSATQNDENEEEASVSSGVLALSGAAWNLRTKTRREECRRVPKQKLDTRPPPDPQFEEPNVKCNMAASCCETYMLVLRAERSAHLFTSLCLRYMAARIACCRGAGASNRDFVTTNASATAPNTASAAREGSIDRQLMLFLVKLVAEDRICRKFSFFFLKSACRGI